MVVTGADLRPDRRRHEPHRRRDRFPRELLHDDARGGRVAGAHPGARARTGVGLGVRRGIATSRATSRCARPRRWCAWPTVASWSRGWASRASASAPMRMGAVEIAVEGADAATLAERIGPIEGIDPVTDVSATAEHRRHLARVLAVRALTDAVARGGRRMSATDVTVTLTVNGTPVTRTPGGHLSLLAWLRDVADVTDPKYGCGEGVCGACTVLVDGAPASACIVLAAPGRRRRGHDRRRALRARRLPRPAPGAVPRAPRGAMRVLHARACCCAHTRCCVTPTARCPATRSVSSCTATSVAAPATRTSSMRSRMRRRGGSRDDQRDPHLQGRGAPGRPPAACPPRPGREDRGHDALRRRPRVRGHAARASRALAGAERAPHAPRRRRPRPRCRASWPCSSARTCPTTRSASTCPVRRSPSARSRRACRCSPPTVCASTASRSRS